MPCQVVQLPVPTLAAILDHSVLGRSQAFGIRDMEARAITAADGERSLRVHVQPLVHCPDLRNHFVDDVYALLLTDGRPAEGFAIIEQKANEVKQEDVAVS